jgi:carbon monoxide dehydrogenase subunit G
MEMTGEQLIPVGQQKVWTALNDPAVLKACIPGCDTIEKVSDNEYKIGMTAAVGPVKAKFAGKLVLGDLNPPNSYSLAFEGSGGAAGFGKGGAKVNLTSEGPAATRLAYSATAQVGGKLAQVGARLIDGVAKKMADDFFKKFNATVAAPGPEEAAAPAAAPAVAPAAAAPAPASAAAPSPVRAAKAVEPEASNPMWIVAIVVIAMAGFAIWVGR